MRAVLAAAHVLADCIADTFYREGLGLGLGLEGGVTSVRSIARTPSARAWCCMPPARPTPTCFQSGGSPYIGYRSRRSATAPQRLQVGVPWGAVGCGWVRCGAVWCGWVRSGRTLHRDVRLDGDGALLARADGRADRAAQPAVWVLEEVVRVGQVLVPVIRPLQPAAGGEWRRRRWRGWRWAAPRRRGRGRRR